jgi:hypothetical protein
MLWKLRTLAIILLAAAMPALAACDFSEGPAERAGEELDRAADKVGDKVEDATR